MVSLARGTVEANRVDSESTRVDAAVVWDRPADRDRAAALVVGDVSALGATSRRVLALRAVRHAVAEYHIGLFLGVDAE